MASALTCLATSVGWCFCTASASLAGSCCGNDKPSSQAPGAHSGRKRSVLLLGISIVLAIVFQFGLTTWLVDSDGILSGQNFVRDAWLDGCEKFENQDPNVVDSQVSEDLLKSCVGNHANFRVSACTTLFFLLAAIGAACKRSANREAWPAKYALYLMLVAAMVFVPSDPLFSDIYLNVARVGGAFFILFQQVVILDLAHNWNDAWVEKSNAAENEQVGGGKKWLAAILVSCAILFLGSIGMLIYMFVEFTGCASNNAFVSLTLVFCVLVTGAQLVSEEGSLLSSGCISAWAVFLCYTAVSKNPDSTCNPVAGELSPLALVFGLLITFISLGWTGWSYTAEDVLSKKGDEDKPAEEAPSGNNDEEEGKRKVTGVVTQGVDNEAKASDADEDEDEDASEEPITYATWKLNVALAFVACWKAMVLTHWGEIQSNDGFVDNPGVGRASMWVIIGSQWLVMSLYLWTLVAPRLFPDRDFN